METKIKKHNSLIPLLNLCPALVTGTLAAVCLALSVPRLDPLPERLVFVPGEETAAQKSKLPEITQIPTEAPQNSTPVEGAVFDLEDGSFEGSARGFGGDITVSVKLEGGRITDVEILSAKDETPAFLERAKAVIKSVLERQSWEVDAVSGATFSSNGILHAIENALTGKEITEAEPTMQTAQPILTPVPFVDLGGYKDGVYYGSAMGFGGNIRVEVEIKDGRISSVKLIEARDETASFLSKAVAVINRIVAKNSPNVDAVSGATYSSNGIINAVKAALIKAGGSDKPVPSQPTAAPTSEPIQADAPDTDGLPDGEYASSADCTDNDIFDYTVSVMLTVKDGRIVGFSAQKLDDRSEDPEANDRFLEFALNGRTVGGRTYEGIASQITRSGELGNIDAVSGATYSSRALVRAAQSALSQAGEEPNGDETASPEPSDTPTPAPESTEPPAETDEPQPDETPITTDEPIAPTPLPTFFDGMYTASAECSDDDSFDYTLLVTVTIDGGVITDVSVEKTDDRSEEPELNDRYLGYAVNGRIRQGVTYIGVPKQITERQSADSIDVVSSATYSSNSIADAAREALDKARKGSESSSTIIKTAEKLKQLYEKIKALPPKEDESYSENMYRNNGKMVKR